MTCWTVFRVRSTRPCKPRSVAAVLLSLLAIHASGVMRLRTFASGSAYDIREHLSTKAPYAHRVRIPGAPSMHDVPDPEGHRPLFMYLLSRHGSRWPTEKRMRQINSLHDVFRAAASNDPDLAWMHNWTSPMAHIPYLAGELHPEGEAELMGLAQRFRGRFPSLVAIPYAPRRYPIISTQVPRAAQSASAFALGFFGSRSSSSNDGAVGGWRPQPVAINMLPKKRDPVLRFFECCKEYRQHEGRALRWLAPWMHSHWNSIVPGLEARMNFKPGTLNPCYVDALWQLCTFEAGLMNTTAHQQWLEQQQQMRSGSSGRRSNPSSSSSACRLFSQRDAVLLEWLEDVRLYETQGYGAQVNYAIAAPLLADIAAALTSAAAAHAAGRPPLQQARLMFAHCETLTPLASLMGLFAPGKEEQQEFPEVPSEVMLKSAVKISDAQLEADLAEVDEVTEDLPLVVMMQQQQQQQQQGAGSDLSRRSSTAADATFSAGQQMREENSGQQQQQHKSFSIAAAKRRRLSEALSSSSSTGGSTISLQATAARAPAETPKQQQQQQLGTKHEHGPAASGCSFKGGEPIDSSLLLLPPDDWLPKFLQEDGARAWRGGRIAPLGAHIALVLYAREDSHSSNSKGAVSLLRLSDYRVRLVYNEQVLRVPGCSSSSGLDCSLQDFLDNVVGDKTSRDKMRQFCSALDDTAAAGDAAGSGRESWSDSSSSSRSSLYSLGSTDLIATVDLEGYASGRGSPSGVFDKTRAGERGLTLTTADGLPLLLPEADSSGAGLPARWY